MYIYFETVAVAFDGSLVTGGMATAAATTREVHRKNDEKKTGWRFKFPRAAARQQQSAQCLRAHARPRVCV